MEFHANDEDTTTITKDGIILSIIQCQTAAEASQRFEQYRSQYPREQAEMSQNIDFGDSYQKYRATGENGVLITVRIGERIAVAQCQDAAKEIEVKALFDQVVK